MVDTTRPGHNRQFAANLIRSGGVLIALTVELPWVHVVIYGNFTMMYLAQSNHHPLLAVLVIAAGLLTATQGFFFPLVRGALAVSALVTVVVAGLGAIQFSREVSFYDPYVSLSIGSYLAIAAVLMLLVGSGLVLRSLFSTAILPTPPLEMKTIGATISPEETRRAALLAFDGSQVTQQEKSGRRALWYQLLTAGLILVLGIATYSVDNSNGPRPALSFTLAYEKCASDGARISAAMEVFRAHNPKVTVTESLLTGNTLGGPYLKSWSNDFLYYFELTRGTLYVRASWNEFKPITFSGPSSCT